MTLEVKISTPARERGFPAQCVGRGALVINESMLSMVRETNLGNMFILFTDVNFADLKNEKDAICKNDLTVIGDTRFAHTENKVGRKSASVHFQQTIRLYTC